MRTPFLSVLCSILFLSCTALADRVINVPLTCLTAALGGGMGGNFFVSLTNPSTVNQNINIELFGNSFQGAPPNLAGGLALLSTYPGSFANIDFDLSDSFSVGPSTFYKKAALKAAKRTIPAGETRFFGAMWAQYFSSIAHYSNANNRLGAMMVITVTGDNGYLMGEYAFCDAVSHPLVRGRAF